MKLLLIGFSEQNAEALKLFMQMKYPEITAGYVPRIFSEKMNLTFPNLTSANELSDAFMIDLEGVGLSAYSEEYEASLAQFINNKAVILISRRPLNSWQEGNSLVKNKTVFLQAPYSKDKISAALDSIKACLQHGKVSQSMIGEQKTSLSATESNSQPTQQDSAHSTTKTTINKNTTEHTADESEKESDEQEPAIDVEAVDKNHISYQVIQEYFPEVYDTLLVKQALVFLTQSEPLKWSSDKYKIIINPKEHSAIVRSDIGRVIDYFALIGKQQIVSKIMQLHPLSDQVHGDIVQKLLTQGYKKYALNIFLWQIWQEVIPQDLKVKEHNLALKVKFVPNFTAMRFVPSYMYSVLSACATKPRSIADLKKLFPDLTSEQLNRIFVLSILSAVADESMLLPEMSRDSKSKKDSDNSFTDNIIKGVQKANKTGFFKRLLQKLSR